MSFFRTARVSPFRTGRVIAFGTFLLSLAVHPAKAQQKAEWTWKDEFGSTHTRAELDEILRLHQQWLESKGKSGSLAHLHGDLRGADLAFAHLHGAELSADLSGANLGGADLGDAWLRNADLPRANLADANLRGAELLLADLRGADLRGTDLTNAYPGGADLRGAIFEPKSLPDLREIASARNLQYLTYLDNPDALVQLRKQFEDAGFREQERQITYALKRREAELSWAGCTSREQRPPLILGEEEKPRAVLWSSDSNLANCASFLLNRVFFDWTCQYGMSPGRPLSLGVLLWLVCSVLYFACIRASGEAGLYRIYAPSIHEDPSGQRRVERISPPAVGKTRGVRRLLQFFQREWAVFRASMFFSLMSAFNIGFRDINFGRWLRLLTRQEFDIKAIGWARVVAGWQSLVSVYLIALWVLTYFGRPFG